MPFTSAAALVLTAIVVPFGAGAPSPTADVPSVTWSVTPADESGSDGRAWVEQELDPGATVTEYVAIRNLGDAAATFDLKSADGYFTDTGRFNMLPSDKESTDAGRWITIAPSVEVAAGETAIVPFTLTVPVNATPGDHAAGVAASITSAGADAAGTRVGVESRVGFRVMTTVTGEFRPGLAIQNMEAGFTPSWDPFAPGRVTITYTAANSGNLQLAVDDRAGDGATTARGDLLPGETRPASLNARAWPLFLMPVELELTGSSSVVDGTVQIHQTVWVWAVPWAQLLVLLGVALLAFAFVAGRRRGRRRLDQLLAEAREQGRRAASD